MKTGKFLTMALILSIFCGLIPTTAMAESISSEVSAVTSGYCGNIYFGSNVQDSTWRFADGKLTIRGTGAIAGIGVYNDYDLSCIPWYPLRNAIHTVIIEEGIERIGDYSFFNLYHLQKVEIPDSLTEIGYSAFQNCSNLKEIVLPHVVSVLSGAFSNCSSLESVSFGSDMEWILAGAFAGCVSLKEVSIPDSVMGLGGWYDEGIYSDAFYGCSALETIEFGSRIELRDDFLHDWEDRYTGYMFGGGDYYQPTNLFSGKSLKNIVIREGNPYLRSGDGVLFDASGETLIRYPRGKQDSHYKIPDGVKTVFPGAFEGCSHLEHVDFPESLERIGIRAFCGCTGLREISIPDGVSIGEQLKTYAYEDDYGDTFRDCINLRTAEVPALVPYMFAGCDNLTEVSVHADQAPERLPERVFLNCFSLSRIDFVGNTTESINLPGDLAKIGERAIYGYDFKEIGTDDGEIDRPGMPETAPQMESQSFGYTDPGNPYTEVYFDDEGVFYLLHQDGSVSLAFASEDGRQSFNSDARQMIESWTDVKQIVDYAGLCIALRTNGKLVYCLDGFYHRESFPEAACSLDSITQWQDINSIICLLDPDPLFLVVVQKEDGSIISQYGELAGALSELPDLSDLAFEQTRGFHIGFHPVGAGKDGKLKAVYEPYRAWLGKTDHIASVQTGGWLDFTALKDDGTVVVTDGLEDIAYVVSRWSGIKEMECSGNDKHIAVGLREDGTVVTTGGAFPESRNWKGVKQILLNPYDYDLPEVLYGLDEDGHILESGNDVSHADWQGVEKLYPTKEGLIGLTADGRLLSDFQLIF